MNIIALIYPSIICAFPYGLVNNLNILAHSFWPIVDMLTVLRIIGIFVAPIGAILGYV